MGHWPRLFKNWRSSVKLCSPLVCCSSQKTVAMLCFKAVVCEMLLTDIKFRPLWQEMVVTTQLYQPCLDNFLFRNWCKMVLHKKAWPGKYKEKQRNNKQKKKTSVFKSLCRLRAKLHAELFGVTHTSLGCLAALFFDFCATLDEDFKRFESTLEAGTLVSD